MGKLNFSSYGKAKEILISDVVRDPFVKTSERRAQLNKHKTDKINENNSNRKLKEKTRIKEIERKAPKSF